VPPEQLLLASLLQAFYGIRSERLLLDQLHYNLLFRWVVVLSPYDPIWHPTTFTKNCERLLNEDVMGKFLERIDGQEDPPTPPSGPGEGFGAPKEGKKRAITEAAGRAWRSH
jgi:hypothetical protein